MKKTKRQRIYQKYSNLQKEILKNDLFMNFEKAINQNRLQEWIKEKKVNSINVFSPAFNKYSFKDIGYTENLIGKVSLSFPTEEGIKELLKIIEVNSFEILDKNYYKYTYKNGDRPYEITIKPIPKNKITLLLN